MAHWEFGVISIGSALKMQPILVKGIGRISIWLSKGVSVSQPFCPSIILGGLCIIYEVYMPISVPKTYH